MSEIAYNSIDANFPVAGQDNNSQGFRDNFTYIKNGLQKAYEEITALQNGTILKGPLAKGDTVVNNLGKQRLFNAVTNRLFQEVRISSESEPPFNIQEDGWAYQKFIVNTDTIWMVAGWPKDDEDNPVYAKVRIELESGTSGSQQIQFTAPAGGIMKTDVNHPVPTPPNQQLPGTLAGSTVSTPTTPGHSVVVDLWSYDAGETVYITYVGTFKPE